MNEGKLNLLNESNQLLGGGLAGNEVVVHVEDVGEQALGVLVSLLQWLHLIQGKTSKPRENNIFFPFFHHIIAQNQRYSHRQLIWSVVIHEKPKCVECLCGIGFIDLSPKPAYSLCTLHYLLLPKLVIKIYSSFFPFLGFEKDWLLGDLISRPWHSKTRRTVTELKRKWVNEGSDLECEKDNVYRNYPRFFLFLFIIIFFELCKIQLCFI